MNKLFNGTANVFIRALFNRTIMGQQYAPGDIIAYLSSVNVTLAFNEDIATANQAGNLLTLKADAYPSTVFISEIKNNDALEKLLYTPSDEVTKFTSVETVGVGDIENGVAYLNLNVDNVVSYSEVRSYNEKGEKIESDFNEEDKTITYTDYENSKIITNFITVVVNSQKVALNKTSLEHLGLEIQLEGKKGIEHGYYVLNVPAAQVLSSPQYEFSEEKLQYGNELIFNIIDSKRNAPTLSFVSE